MSSLKYAKPKKILLKGHPKLNERWVQERIAEDPSLLGLGDLILKDKERIHPQGGRLDFLCQDSEANRRYEIEIQLGKSDPRDRLSRRVNRNVMRSLSTLEYTQET